MRGVIPHVREGRTVRIRVEGHAMLRHWGGDGNCGIGGYRPVFLNWGRCGRFLRNISATIFLISAR